MYRRTTSNGYNVNNYSNGVLFPFLFRRLASFLARRSCLSSFRNCRSSLSFCLLFGVGWCEDRGDAGPEVWGSEPSTLRFRFLFFGVSARLWKWLSLWELARSIVFFLKIPWKTSLDAATLNGGSIAASCGGIDIAGRVGMVGEFSGFPWTVSFSNFNLVAFHGVSSLTVVPLKNREYSPRLATSFRATAMTERRFESWGRLCSRLFGLGKPEDEEGSALWVAGRRWERIPVWVRLRETAVVRAEPRASASSNGGVNASSSSESAQTLIWMLFAEAA